MPAKVKQKDEEQPQHLVVASHHHGSDFGSKVIVGAAMIEAALLAVYGAVHPSFLPLGGGHFEQGGVIFCTVVAVEGFHHLYRQGAFNPIINAVAALGDFTIRKC